MTQPTIDFLVPVYNAAATLDQTLASIAAQDFTQFRVILIDDGSTDDSPRILADWQAQDARFHVVRQINTGIVGALNHGLSLVNAPFLARMDADDICDPARLTRQMDYLAQNADCVAVGCRVNHIDVVGNPIHGLPQPGDPMTADPLWVPAREPYLIHPFMTARTEAVKSAGGYRNVPHSEDSDLFWRLSDHGRLHNLEEVLGAYRLHGSSISSGSVVDGRVMAIGSRLGALSTVMRRAGREDIFFVEDLQHRLRLATSLEAMCEVIKALVDVEELPRFKLGVAIKLLELASYRPYEIDIDDCRFIAFQVRQMRPIGLGNRREIEWHLTCAVTRLLRNGRFGEAMALATPRLIPRIALHILRR